MDRSGGHIDVLDGVRGLAILLVMETHFYGLPLNIVAIAQPSALDGFFYRLLSPGWSGVDLFFVLSGFLITGILFDAKGSAGYFRNFFARRALRILPVYYGYLVLVLWLLPDTGLVSNLAAVDALERVQAWFWTFTVNVGTALKGGETLVPNVHMPFWSLAIEEQFYLLWPLVVFSLGRSGLIRLCAGLLVLAPLLRIALGTTAAAAFFAPQASTMLMPARADALAMGALLALVARGPGGLQQLRAPALVVATVAGVALVAVWTMRGGLLLADPLTPMLTFSLLLLLYGALMVRVLTTAPQSTLHAVFAHPVLRFFGRYSYAMYVFHLLVAFLLAGQVDVVQQALGWNLVFSAAGSYVPFNLLFSACATAVVTLAGWLSWHLFEKRFLSLKRYFPYGARRGAGDIRGA